MVSAFFCVYGIRVDFLDFLDCPTGFRLDCCRKQKRSHALIFSILQLAIFLRTFAAEISTTEFLLLSFF